MKKITPFLWFDNQAEEAANFYVSVFPASKILSTERYHENTPGEPGTVMTVNFEINGLEFIALNGGPHFKINPAISFFVHCENQEEVDYFWEKLSEGGEKGQCGWLEDRFGVSWQIVPTVLGELMSSEDKAKAYNVTQAMLKMTKLDIDELLNAYEKNN